MASDRKEGNVLFNDALNTFYLRLYGIRHIIKEGRKEMFYLMMHSTHFIYSYMASDRKEGNVLFNDALNTFYLRLYGIRHIVTEGRKEGNVLFNDALNTFYLRLYGIRHIKEGRKEMFYLMLHSTHFIYSYMASDIS